MRLLPSVRARLTAWSVGVVACVLILSGLAVRYLLEEGLIRAVDADLSRQGQFWGGFFERLPNLPAGRPRARPGGGPPGPGGDNALRPRVLLRGGRDIWGNGPWDQEAFSRSLGGERITRTFFSGDQELRLLSIPGRRRGEIQGVIQIVAPLSETRRAVSQLTQTLVILIPVALGLAAVGGALITRRSLQPVREIIGTARRIEPHDLSARVPSEGKDEFAQLAQVLNGMLERLEEAFERQKRFVGDASHELRTPLATIKATSSLAREDEWGAEACQAAMVSIEGASDRAARIVEDLLILARADSSRLVGKVSRCSVDEILHDAVEICRGSARGNSARAMVMLELPEGEPLRVTGEAAHLTRVFTNLLDNALRHTPAEGRVTLAARPSGESVIVTVTDTGEGIPPEHLPHLGERFYRVDAARHRSRGGAGLGLAICRAILEAHHGSLSIESRLGEGTEISVKLPRVD